MARFITFRFDDGFIEGARKAAAFLHPSPASFFIVAGLVTGSDRLDHIELFRGRNFGSLDRWRAIDELGHDVQPHGVTHCDFAELSADQQRIEVRMSVDLVRGIHGGPYIFGFPYNNMVADLDLTSFGVSAAGFVTASSDEAIVFNRTDDPEFDLFRLRSWAVRERHFHEIVDQLDSPPDQSWTILAFHSLDGEGHEPWTSQGFFRLLEFVRAAGLQIVSIREMVGCLTDANGASPLADSEVRRWGDRL
jgi:peptidoglycan/xylan/chitin deacetylase (PgdA/CDA1 family)